MCGIDGMLRLDPQAPVLDLGALRRTRAAQARRGPDGEGEWVSPDGTVALGHRRLAILDLSPAGQQPMVSPDGAHVLILNGEIYNYRELRAELGNAARALPSTGDTAVVLALYARHGVAMLGRLRGMFALALWDAPRRRLLLARDPHGIKPLYYAVEQRTLRFASQVKALEAGGVARDLDPAGSVGFLLWGSVPEPLTIRRAVRALPAGSSLVIDDGRVGEPQPYATNTDLAVPTTTAAEAVEDAIRSHLVADVPVATFLSGGLDSALITAVARRHLPTPPRTFTLRFDRLIGTSADEGPLAAQLARQLGCPHEERVLGATDVAGLWEAGLAAMDQPSIDGFNTWLVSRAAHEAGLKVVLSGLGGDEIFGSYPSFADVPRLRRTARRLARIPGAARAWPRAAALIPDRPKLAGLLRYGQSLDGAYFLRRGLFLPEELPGLLPPDVLDEGLARLADPRLTVPSRTGADPAGPDAWRAVQRLESTLYMRNQLLRDSDWASMAHSLELRVPFVDAVLSTTLAAQNFEPARSAGKATLARQVAPELPGALFERAKHGFTIPLVEWLRPETAKLRPGQRSRWLARRVLAHWDTKLASSS